MRMHNILYLETEKREKESYVYENFFDLNFYIWTKTIC